MVYWNEVFSGVNWIGFSIAFVLLIVLPVWFMDFVGEGLSFVYKLVLTIGGGAATFMIVQKGGSKRGIFSR